MIVCDTCGSALLERLSATEAVCVLCSRSVALTPARLPPPLPFVTPHEWRGRGRPRPRPPSGEQATCATCGETKAVEAFPWRDRKHPQRGRHDVCERCRRRRAQIERRQGAVP